MRRLVLGRGGPRRQTLRDGELEFVSARGLAPVTRALIGELPARPPRTVLAGRDPRGAVALAAAALWPGTAVHLHHLDAWLAARALENLGANGLDAVTRHVTADLPAGPDGYDLVLLGFPAGHDALLARHLVEQAHDRLAVGGRLLAATDRPPARLRDLLKQVFGQADVQRSDRRGASVVAARRRKPESRERDHDHVVVLERGGRSLEIRTRPGVFVAGRIDPGTRALLDSFEALPGERILDVGCGSGVLGIAAAAEAGDAGLVLVDSNVRAVELAAANAKANGLERVTPALRADLEDLPSETCQLALLNPPYFSKGRIAWSFALCAARHAGEGRTLLVARQAALHREVLDDVFGVVCQRRLRGYSIFEATRPRPAVLAEHARGGPLT